MVRGPWESAIPSRSGPSHWIKLQGRGQLAPHARRCVGQRILDQQGERIELAFIKAGSPDRLRRQRACLWNTAARQPRSADAHGLNARVLLDRVELLRLRRFEPGESRDRDPCLGRFQSQRPRERRECRPDGRTDPGVLRCHGCLLALKPNAPRANLARRARDCSHIGAGPRRGSTRRYSGRFSDVRPCQTS